MEAVNNNSSMVMTGMRVQVGTQAIERAPSYVEVFGRTMQINLIRARWFDFPFTREEALQADKKLSIFSKNCLFNNFHLYELKGHNNMNLMSLISFIPYPPSY